MFGFGRRDPSTRLKVLMAERDINVSELADMTGLHKNTIVAIRTGDTTRPCTETRYAIARALNVKVNDIWANA